MPLAVGSVLALLAVRLAERRDLGSAPVALGPGPARARAGLRRPFGLAAWIHRPSTIGWLAGGVLLTGMLGALSQQMVDAMTGNPALAEAMGTVGEDPLLGLIAVTQLYLAVVASGYVVQAIGTLRAEEADGRLETRLAGTLSRTRWLAAHSAVVLLGLVVVVGGSSLVFAGTTALSVGDAADAGDVLRSGLAYLPAELVLAGLALALYGLRPRWFPLAWVGYAVVTFIAFLGPGLELPTVGPRPRPHHPHRQPARGVGAGHRCRRPQRPGPGVGRRRSPVLPSAGCAGGVAARDCRCLAPNNDSLVARPAVCAHSGSAAERPLDLQPG